MALRGHRTGKVARVRLELPHEGDLFRTRDEQVVAGFVPGTSTSRYGRTWFLGRVQIDNGVLSGRIGFEAEGVADVWDPARTDFIETAIPSGVTSPFVLRLSDLAMVFQTRGAIIKVNSFVGAMQALLREATREEWTLVTSQRKITFEGWRATVTRVTRMRFHLVPPNPNYEDRPDVQRLLAESSAAGATVDLSNPDGLTDSEIVEQLIDHVQRGYGDATMFGERNAPDGRTVESVYNTRLQGESEVHDRPTDEHGDVPIEELTRELTGDQTAEQADEHG